jgi:DNA-binding response OmpR family regulator
MVPVLLFEDQEDLCEIIKETFQLSNFKVTCAFNGSGAQNLFTSSQPKVVLVDIMMPGTDGFTAIREIRKINQTVPILVLTAKPQTDDLLKAYELGCNDYIRKPFVMEELIARVKAFTRTNQPAEINKEERNIFRIGQLILNTDTQELSSPSEIFNLSYKEAEILKRFCLFPNRIVSRKDLLEEFWGSDNVFNSKNMNVYINKIRNYFLKDPAVTLLTIRGIGYKLVVKSNYNDY